MARVLAGVFGVLATAIPAVAAGPALSPGEATVHTIADATADELRELQGFMMIYRGMRGCQSLGAIFSEADVAMMEGFLQARFADVSVADRQRAWNDAGELLGDSVDKLYFMAAAKRETECRGLADVAVDLGLNLPSRR
ncbi:hypothetical protein AB7M35_000311 [Amorphus suaedae]